MHGAKLSDGEDATVQTKKKIESHDISSNIKLQTCFYIHCPYHSFDNFFFLSTSFDADASTKCCRKSRQSLCYQFHKFPDSPFVSFELRMKDDTGSAKSSALWWLMHFHDQKQHKTLNAPMWNAILWCIPWIDSLFALRLNNDGIWSRLKCDG